VIRILRLTLAVIIAIPALLLLERSAHAQVADTGSIEVLVQDPGGLPVPGAVVTARADDVVTSREAVTDVEGRALLIGLAPSARYVVSTELAGFAPARNDNVLVRTGQTVTLRVALSVGALTEQVRVTVESPIVDTRSAATGQDITLQLTESLPTGRSYQSYLQIVPGVLPDDPQQPGNPAAKSGLNYSDIGGNLGVSRDNFYYFNGINVTDPVTGTFGANLNTEIIQEQQVLTGGIPAEFVGTPGPLSSVVTKSGSNAFHGSVNYFFQNDGLVGENANSPDEEFSTFDAAGTVGGPIVRDQAWFFGSYRRLEREDDVTSLDTNELLRTVNNEQDQWYGRVTWAPTRSDTISATFLNDPTTISGQRSRTLTNARDRSRVQGGDNYSVNYSRLQGGALLEAAYNVHNGEVSDFAAIREAGNTVVFRGSDVRTLADEQLGGFGEDSIDQRDTSGARGSVQWLLGRHTLKGGLEWSRNENFRDEQIIDGATYTSLANHLAGISAGELATGSFTSRRFNPFTTNDFTGLMRTVGTNAALFAQLDANRDGTVTPAEVAANLRFSSTAGNPNGRVNYDRTFLAQQGAQETKSEGLTVFAQDEFRVNRLTFNLGVRAERWEHFDTTGTSTFTFDWELAPRLSAAYDLRGDGRQKVFGYYGRYYDPVRNNMTNFAGSVTGSVTEEQVFINDQWVTYRIRGGSVQPDALFAPTTQTPYVDDFTGGYQVDLGGNMSFEGTYTYRRTRDVLEDYDLDLYAIGRSGTTSYPGPVDHPDSRWLGLDYFGYAENPGANFVIATLAGGERNYQGVDLVFRKRYSDNWQVLASYTYNWAEGNTNSDSNADFQGDDIALDPRAPNQFGRQPGLIPHLFKFAGSYITPVGVELGANYRWNSGSVASRTFLAFGRNLPVQVDKAFEFAGFDNFWLAPDAVGTLQNPSWGTLDLRVQYRRRFADAIGGELFVDVFNVLDNQDAIREQDLVAGSGGTAFGEPIRFLDPRRFFLGARLRF
jgi:hypothetical protein